MNNNKYRMNKSQQKIIISNWQFDRLFDKWDEKNSKTKPEIEGG